MAILAICRIFAANIQFDKIMNVIEINSENYKDYLHLDIIAFSFAGEGAQGEGGGGGLWMVTSAGKLYHTNFAYTISWEQAILLCPTLQACDCDLFRTTPPEGWQSYYMGGGNFLIVKDTYTEIFSQLDPYDLYGQWKDILIEKIK